MKAVKQIDPPEWMTGPGCEKIMRAIGGYEPQPQALFVGGCVRDHLLGRGVRDIDIAASHPPETLIEMLKKAGIKSVPTGIEHGTVTAVEEGRGFEITALRRDVETDGRHAVVAYTQDWAEDARRRDFTMNTLLAGPDGRIYDPTGRGLADLEKRRVIFVGDPARRIAEDHLRILRFFRFHAQVGEGLPDEVAVMACRAAADRLAALSKERITQEMLKIISVDNTVNVLGLMFKNNVLKDFPDKKYWPDELRYLCEIQKKYEAFHLPARLFVLGGMKEDFFDAHLILTNAQKKEIGALHDAFHSFSGISERNVKVMIYRYNNDIALQVLFLRRAGGAALIELARTWQAPVFPVTGEDLIKQGMEQGPALGEKLRRLEEDWIARGFQ